MCELYMLLDKMRKVVVVEVAVLVVVRYVYNK